MIDCKFENGKNASLRHCTADTVVLDKTHTKILLVLRKKDNIVGAGKWALPGGFVDRDETIAQAASREVYEETGYEVKDVALLRFNDNPNGQGGDRQNVAFAFKAIATKKTGQPDDESEDVKWFDLDSLPDESDFAFDHYKIIKENIK